MIPVGPLVAVGRTSDLYAYGEGSIVKVPRPGVPSTWAAREADYTAAVRRLGAPAPEVRGLVRIEGREAIVFERIEGDSMWQKMLASPADLPALARDFADVHRSILSVGLPAGVASSVERICLKLSEAGQLSAADRVEAQHLARSFPNGAALLHGDLHPGNVLMGDRGPVVIDWFDAAVGHPITDVIRTSLLIRRREDGWPLHLPGAVPEILDRLFEVYIGALSDVLNVGADMLRCWESVVAASRLAEGAERDASVLVALWERRRGPGPSRLIEMLSATGGAGDGAAHQGPQ